MITLIIIWVVFAVYTWYKNGKQDYVSIEMNLLNLPVQLVLIGGVSILVLLSLIIKFLP